MIFLKELKVFYLGFLGLMLTFGFVFCSVLLGEGVAMDQPGMNIYPANPPGQTEKLERPYKGAPPLIPHSVGGLGVTRSSNDCLACHSEGIEVEKGHIATKIPPSHYLDEYTAKQMKDKVIGVRYNCIQCHVPQSQEEPSDLRKK
jgi:cytochrome c-type protein NapB